MTYIPKKDEARLKLALKAVDVAGPAYFQYAVSQLTIQFLENSGVSRPTLAMAMGVLEEVQQELYRRIVLPYESGEQLSTGDMFQDLVKRAGLRTL